MTMTSRLHARLQKNAHRSPFPSHERERAPGNLGGVDRDQAVAACGSGLWWVSTVSLALAVQNIAYGAQVKGTPADGVFTASDGTFMVSYTLPSGEGIQGEFPMPEHKNVVQAGRGETVWYHPQHPQIVVDYSKSWPVPYLGCMAVAIFLPVLLAHTVALMRA